MSEILRATANRLRALAIVAGAALAAACAQTVAEQPGKKDYYAEPPPQSIEQARAQCWMRYEKDKVVNNLDAKIKLVDKCIEEKGKNLPPAS